MDDQSRSGITAGVAAVCLSLVFYSAMLATADDLRAMIHVSARFGDPAIAVRIGGMILATISGVAITLAFAPTIRRDIDEMCAQLNNKRS